MDSYQAIYDATRQALRCDPERAISEAVGTQVQRLSYAIDIIQQDASAAAYQHARPSAVYRPALMQDGNAWLAIYGDLPTGVSGCGDSPESAMADFDKKWHEKAQGIDGKPDQLLVAFPGFGTALDSLNALSATPKPL